MKSVSLHYNKELHLWIVKLDNNLTVGLTDVELWCLNKLTNDNMKELMERLESEGKDGSER